MSTRYRSIFENVIHLVLGLIILGFENRHHLLATLSKRPHTNPQHLLPLFQPQC